MVFRRFTAIVNCGRQRIFTDGPRNSPPALKGPVVGNWLLEELREHGYRVSPGTLYPLPGRMVRIGWLAQRRDRSYRITIAGRQALVEGRTRRGYSQANSLQSVADTFTASQEFINLDGSLSDTA